MIIFNKEYWKLLIKFYWKIKPANGPEKWTILDYIGIDFDINAYLLEVKAYQDKFNIKTCYTTEYQNKTYEALELNWAGAQAKKKLLLSAGMHGNEISGVLAIPRILRDISLDAEYYKDWEIKIITPVNPVGTVFQSRYNKDGIDINRDFKDYKTIEAKNMKEILFSFKPDMIVNFHEACHPKGLLILANHSSSKVKTHELARRLDEKIELAERHYMRTRLEMKGLEREGWFLILLEKIFGSTGLEQLADDQKVTSLTIESSWMEKNKEKRINSNYIAFKEIIDVFR
ncbi:MAG: DUF2817 domain-containing protein [Candidatus Pacebacteria bacterium]|nr:DUF2817 domain-containing protein [Candidatus Paceibacterota bacterium]